MAARLTLPHVRRWIGLISGVLLVLLVLVVSVIDIRRIGDAGFQSLLISSVRLSDGLRRHCRWRSGSIVIIMAAVTGSGSGIAVMIVAWLPINTTSPACWAELTEFDLKNT